MYPAEVKKEMVKRGWDEAKEAWERRLWPLLTIDIKTVPVKFIGAQPGDAMGQLTQLPVQMLSVQSRACGVRAMGTHSINPCSCSILLRPGEGR